MLVLSRQRDECVIIGEGKDVVRITIVDIRGDKVRLGFEARVGIQIHREEVYLKIQEEKAADAKLLASEQGH